MYFLPGGVKSLRYSAYHLAVSKMFTVISSLSVDTLGTKHAKKKGIFMAQQFFLCYFLNQSERLNQVSF